MKKKHLVFFDMDGVLADFDAAFTQLNNGVIWGPPDYDPNSEAKKEKWAKIKSDYFFFSKLPWVPGAKELWDFANEHCSTAILSAASQNITNSKSQKIEWCKRELGFTTLECYFKMSYSSTPGRKD
jgi:5'(3')-deoxyribonucleotidase